MGKLIPITGTVTEPITLQEARLHLRLDADGSPASHSDDSIVSMLISVARQAAEQYLGKTIAMQSFELALDVFPEGPVSLETWPVVSITSIEYQDPNGVVQTLTPDKYVFDYFSKPAQIVVKEIWPPTKNETNAIKITFVAGHTDGQSPNVYPLPIPVKQAMLLTIGHLYENREAVSMNEKYEMPMGTTALLTPYRISMGL